MLALITSKCKGLRALAPVRRPIVEYPTPPGGYVLTQDADFLPYRTQYMKPETYERLKRLIQFNLQRPPTPEACAAIGVSRYEAAVSARHHILVRLVKSTSAEQRRKLPALRRRFEQGEHVLDLAREQGFPPYLLARMFVEDVCRVPRAQVSQLVKRPELIESAHLRQQLLDCISADADFSPDADKASNRIGREYEELLAARLAELGVPFETEDMLRSQGMPKTPDVRLLVPLGITTPEGKEHVVTWIDSKAMFGDLETITQEVLPQVTSYVNRFGPGLVIFWFDLVEGLGDALGCRDVVLMDRFPEQLMLPTGAILTWPCTAQEAN